MPDWRDQSLRAPPAASMFGGPFQCRYNPSVFARAPSKPIAAEGSLRLRHAWGLRLALALFVAASWGCDGPAHSEVTGTSVRLTPTRLAPVGTSVARLSPTSLPTATRDDTHAPRIQLRTLPATVRSDEGLKVVASADDDVAVVAMALLLDGLLVLEVGDGALRHNLDTRALAVGEHVITVRARDPSGNTDEVQARFELLAGAQLVPSPTETAPPPVTATRTATLPVPSPTATAVATPTTRPAEVSVAWGEVTINTYGYEQALYSDPAKAGHPYPLLRWDAVGAPRPRAYRVLILRNEYLELTFMPELGGRLYQCRFLPTGQTLLYNNRVIKPTHWGPEEQGWWLAAGGIEFCLPVEEHGYLSAQPWGAEVVRLEDGGAMVVMSIQERTRNISARVSVALRPHEAGFTLRSEFANRDDRPKELQYWINAMLSPGAASVGPGLRLIVPASEVLVHSRGDKALPDAQASMPWPWFDGRDLSRYATWRQWLGFFATKLQRPFTAVYDDTTELGMVRVFPADIARGAKVFGFGSGFDAGVYTDDGSQYVEMWGGLTPTFWDKATLPAQGAVAWEESWWVLSRSRGTDAATTSAALSVQPEGDHWSLTLSARTEANWVLSVKQGTRMLAQQACAVRPGAPCRATVARGGSVEPLLVSVTGGGQQMLSYEIREGR